MNRKHGRNPRKRPDKKYKRTEIVAPVENHEPMTDPKKPKKPNPPKKTKPKK